MTHDTDRNRVYIKRLEEYDRQAIWEIVGEGMRELGYEPKGKVFAKPNVVVAHRHDKMGHHGCTRTELVGASTKGLERRI